MPIKNIVEGDLNYQQTHIIMGTKTFQNFKKKDL